MDCFVVFCWTILKCAKFQSNVIKCGRSLRVWARSFYFAHNELILFLHFHIDYFLFVAHIHISSYHFILWRNFLCHKLRKLFFLCVTPNILNGFHVASYVFLGQPPKDHWCVIPDLINSNWSDSQMRTISASSATT